MKSYTFAASVTTPNSATLPVGNIVGGTTARPTLYEILMGSSSAPNDHAGQFSLRRCSTAGTAGTNPTPTPIDPGDAAAICTLGLAIFGSGPTLGVTLMQWAVNQRAAWRWVAAPGKEFKGPATANNGLALMNPAVDSTYTLDFTMAFEE